jgi:hypothetical protein
MVGRDVIRNLRYFGIRETINFGVIWAGRTEM